MTPNIDQVLMILRVLLSVGGPVGALLVARGMTADQVTALSTSVLALVGALPPLVSLIWGMFNHSNLGTIKAAAALPDVARIVIKPSATDGIAAAAADPTQPKIVPVNPLPQTKTV